MSAVNAVLGLGVLLAALIVLCATAGHRRHRRKPATIALALPIMTTKEGLLLPNFELANDEVATIPILVDDAAGNPVPAPSGDTFSATSSNPASLTAAIGATSSGATALVLTPLVLASPGLTVTVSDSAGLASATQVVDIVSGAPSNIFLDTAHATETPQAQPSNPGP